LPLLLLRCNLLCERSLLRQQLGQLSLRHGSAA
jgi:hypothetical protein